MIRNLKMTSSWFFVGSKVFDNDDGELGFLSAGRHYSCLRGDRVVALRGELAMQLSNPFGSHNCVAVWGVQRILRRNDSLVSSGSDKV